MAFWSYQVAQIITDYDYNDILVLASLLNHPILSLNDLSVIASLPNHPTLWLSWLFSRFNLPNHPTLWLPWLFSPFNFAKSSQTIATMTFGPSIFVISFQTITTIKPFWFFQVCHIIQYYDCHDFWSFYVLSYHPQLWDYIYRIKLLTCPDNITKYILAVICWSGSKGGIVTQSGDLLNQALIFVPESHNFSFVLFELNQHWI